MSQLLNLDRRTVLQALGAGAIATAGMTGTVAGDHRSKGGNSGGGNHLDPLWGYTNIVDDLDDGFPERGEFPPQMRPDHTVSLEFAEGMPPHFHPAGLAIEPGDIIMFEFPTPDHTVTAFHERFRGGQRVPADANPFSSPVLPAGGYWLYRFGEAGVYDLFCAPHEFMGMVMRIVATDDDQNPPSAYGPSVHGPSPFNIFNHLKELGLAPQNPPFTVPSSLAALTSEALSPANILTNETVHYPVIIQEINSP